MSTRWLEITASPYPHEVEGLNRIKAILPNHAPFRAWSNFEFRDGNGKWHEVDLLVLGRRRLHLVELKYYSGTLRGDDHRWMRDGHRAEDSPLKLARRKAQRLASKLKDELLRWAREHGQQIPDVRDVVPFVQESVFLHHPAMRSQLRTTTDLFGLDGSGLPDITDRLLEPATPQQVIGANRDEIIAALLTNIGVVQRRQRDVGSWLIDDAPQAEGDGWQDWPAYHRVATTDRARIRFFVTAPGAAESERQRVRRVADHEFRVMTRLAHDGLLRPRDLVQDELGVGLVYPHDDRLQRLDLWLADNATKTSLADQLSILRQVAEAVGYAHANRVVHRGLGPAAVSVRSLQDGGLKAVVGDWQSAGNVGDALTGLPSAGVTSLIGTDSAARLAALQHGPDPDVRLAEAFQAPEGRWHANADRVRLDVFSLGAVAYYVLAGKSPGPDRTALKERLLRDQGLDLAADVPQISSALRALVKEATHPAVGDRMPDVRTFLERLAAAERPDVGEEADDPLEATPGAILGGRYRLERRLGQGSTAVGLLVTDLTLDGSAPKRVLKVALDDTASHRLTAEAEVLASLDDPRLVKLLDGPLDVGARRALLLENAGEQTLGEVLRSRTRLSLDLLERYGTDLLEALVALDRAGVDHRDLKPSNLGVREGRGDRTKHLVLFDFSLSRAGATALNAGTPPYLDPFLDTPARGRFDTAAERYSAAVVLFEMATGSTPVYGDPLSDPSTVPDEATVEPALFDESIADRLTTFFRRALARDAKQRHDTAADVLTAWRAVFAPLPKTVPDDADQRAAAAEPSTLLTEAGLSARALSALEPYRVSTVGDLVALDPVRLNRLSGVAEATRKEVKDRAKTWRDRLASVVTGRGPTPDPERNDFGLPDPLTASDLLVQHAGAAKAEARRTAARLLLGLDTRLEPFASRVELSRTMEVTRARADQYVDALQQAWADAPACRDLLDAIAGHARSALDDLGGVATVDELTIAVRQALAPMTRHLDGPAPDRLAAGLLRVALDRVQARGRADAGDDPLSTRRHQGRLALLSTDPRLLDAVNGLGRVADDLAAQAQLAQEPVLASVRAFTALRESLDRALGTESTLPDGRLLRLAAALSATAAVSGADELHHRSLTDVAALGLALKGVGGAQPVSPQEVRDRVRARFPLLPALPDRPRLDALVDEAQLGLRYDETAKAYRSMTRVNDTTGLVSRAATYVQPADTVARHEGHLGQRLADSRRSRSFLALGVDAGEQEAAIDRLVRDHDAVVVDLTGVLIDAMRATADERGIPWDAVQAADAAEPGTRDREGLAALVRQALPAVDEAIELAGQQAPEATQPLLLLEAAPLARYNALSGLVRWTDLTASRRQAVWLLIPQLAGSQGAMVDSKPLPLAAPGQYLRLDLDWLHARADA